jgi:uncharacterized protein YyaL (SSP411 family)
MPNRLIHSQSLYLRKHADNPIDWWSWSDEALDAARSQDKPIFLSIGYSSCHWCTVMETEAFSDPMIADYMNANFIAIKVDREERPDLDSIYMQAVQIMGKNGGWPLNLFLTPDDLVPFYGDTYFPIEPRYGRPGFLKVLQSLHQVYCEKRDEIRTYNQEIVTNLSAIAKLDAIEAIDASILINGINKCIEVVVNRGMGTCFPMIPYASLGLQAGRFNSSQFNSEFDQSATRLKATQRGLDLSLGGIFDHVAGGWHRYTVDPTWTVPHFEKMLYDNGLIMEYMANLWASGFQEPAIERAIAQTVTWLQREMRTVEGYFYASQDADSEGKEGKFWVWSYGELKRMFAEAELRQLADNFTITAEGNFEEQNVLQRLQPGTLANEVESSLSKLFQKRYGEYSQPTDAFPPARNQEDIRRIAWSGRVPPVTDTKMVVAWNALMISGLARVYQVFSWENSKQLAQDALEFILQNQWFNDRFYRVSYDGNPSVFAQSEDYALLIKALLDMQQAVPVAAKYYLQEAIRLQTEFDRWLWDDQAGGYFNTASDASEHLLVREKSYQDNATPAANGIAIVNLVRLSLLTENLDYLDRAEAALKAFGGAMQDRPIACPSLISALDWFQNQTLVRVSEENYPWLSKEYHPTTVFKLEEMPNLETAGLVCQGLKCLPAATTVQQLREQLAHASARVI